MPLKWSDNPRTPRYKHPNVPAGKKPSEDIDVRDMTPEPKKSEKHTFATPKELYVENIGQPVATVKAIASDVGEYVKEKVSPSKQVTKADPFVNVQRASRDLGGPRTPPYKGAK